MVRDHEAEAKQRAADSPEDIVAVFDRCLQPSRDYPWTGQFVLGFGDETARLTVRLPRWVLELDGTPPTAWAELDDVPPEQWERELLIRLTDLGADGTPPEQSVARWNEFSRYERNGLTLDLVRVPAPTLAR